jgi:HME family heavy-metal exporter
MSSSTGALTLLHRQPIAERLAVIRDQLPANSSPVMGPISSIMGQILPIA